MHRKFGLGYLRLLQKGGMVVFPKLNQKRKRDNRKTMEKTLVILKPGAVQRALVGEVTARFERKGLRLAGMKMMQLTDELLNEH